MTAHLKFAFSALTGLAAMAAASAALAGPPGCGSRCAPPPPPPPPPPPMRPMPPRPPVTIVTPPVVAIAISNAQAGARASALAQSTVFVGGGGFAGGVAASAATSAAINVGAAEIRRVPYQERRRMERTVIIRAVCVDDRFVPHAASQLFRERDVLEGYVGELYRCIAGTSLQVTLSEWGGSIEASTGQGETINCRRGEALWHARGQLTCRPATPQRDCFERSRLRLWGAGVKVMRYVREEVVTAYREERVEATASGMLVMDGGVGGIVY